MKHAHLLPVIIISVFSLTWSSCNKNGKTSSEPDNIVVMTSSPSLVTESRAEVSGIFTGNALLVSAGGFTYGTTVEMTEQIDATISGNSLSATLPALNNNTKYYFRAYVISEGKTITGDTKSFTTARGDVLKDQKWIELPAYTTSTTHIAKSYFTTLNNGYGRNYSILYDTEKTFALWVAFPMNNSVHLGSVSRSDDWQYDTSGDIPTSAQANAKKGSYDDADYDLGHQIASADRSCTYEANTQTFLATNITPQYNLLNQGAWLGLETGIRNVATGKSSGTTIAQTIPDRDTLYIVTGPLLTSSNPKYVPDKDGKECLVPDGYFKVILWSKHDSETNTRSYDSIGFMWKENDAANKEQNVYPNFAASVTAVEQYSGLSFFGNLSTLGLSAAQIAEIKKTSSWDTFKVR